jgi:hypothetical protein
MSAEIPLHEFSPLQNAERCSAFQLGSSLFNRLQDVCDHLGFGLGALRALAVQAHANVAGFEVATTDDEHRVDFGFFRVGDFALDRVGAEIGLDTDFAAAKFVGDLFPVGNEIVIGIQGQDADLFGREPEREIAGVMFDQKANETFVRAEGRAVNAEWRLL